MSGIFLWCVNVFDISELDVITQMNLLDSSTQRKLRLPSRFEDRRRALVSHLLQRRAAKAMVGETSFSILRTNKNKPFIVSDVDLGTWNFNVSHHGNFVCLIADSENLVGIDIVERKSHSRLSTREYLQLMSPQLHESEMNLILSLPSEENQMSHFLLLWALKESYSKALGTGLGCDFSTVHFNIQFKECELYEGTATASVNTHVHNDWKFIFFSLDQKHVVATARKPFSVAEQTQSNSLPELHTLSWSDLIEGF